MTVIYMDADITVSPPVNDHQENDLRTWLGGTEVGAVPDTPFNPVLYRAGGAAPVGQRGGGLNQRKTG